MEGRGAFQGGLGLGVVGGKLKACSGIWPRGHEWTCASQPATSPPGPPTLVAGSEWPLMGRPAQAPRPTQGRAWVFLWVPSAGAPLHSDGGPA